MIRYSTTTSVGVANNFKKEPITALEYIKNKKQQLNLLPSEIDFINILQVDVHSLVDEDQMRELVTSIYPDLTELMSDSEKIGLSIKIGQNSLKKLIHREDDYEEVTESIMNDYISNIKSTTQTETTKKIEPSTM